MTVTSLVQWVQVMMSRYPGKSLSSYIRLLITAHIRSMPAKVMFSSFSSFCSQGWGWVVLSQKVQKIPIPEGVGKGGVISQNALQLDYKHHALLLACYQSAYLVSKGRSGGLHLLI